MVFALVHTILFDRKERIMPSYLYGEALLIWMVLEHHPRELEIARWLEDRKELMAR